jgi:hypothetical protein
MPYQSPSDYWGIPEEEAAALPLGLRYSNNPFNVKHYRGAENNQEKWPGLMGPSVALDDGDPQMKFDNPENGAVGGAQLLQRKYASGMTTPNSIIAGRAGWTPGNYDAARNVGALAGVGLDGDLKLDTPEGMRRMLPALAAQEHGPKGQRLMTPEFWDKATEMATGAQFASGALPRLKLLNLDGSNAHRWGAPVQQPGRGAPMAVYARDESNPTEDEAWRLERLLAKDTQRTASAAPEKGGVGRFAKPALLATSSIMPGGSGLVRGAAGHVGLPGTVETLGRMGILSGGNQSPMSDGTREDRQPSLMDQIAARTQNPLFQQGLGMFLAASQGKDLNEGLTAGSNRAKSMQDVMMRNLALQKQAAAQARIKEMMNNPATMGQVPPALAEFVRATEDPSPIAQYVMRQPEAEMNRKRLDQQLRLAEEKSKRDADIHPHLIDRHKAQAEAARARASHYIGRVQPVSGPPETIIGERPNGEFYEMPADTNAQLAAWRPEQVVGTLPDSAFFSDDKPADLNVQISEAPRVESGEPGGSTSVPETTRRKDLNFGQYGLNAGNVPGVVTNRSGRSDKYATEVHQGQQAVSSMPAADRERALEFKRRQRIGHWAAGKPKQGFVYDRFLRQVPSGSPSASADAQERKDRAIGLMIDQLGDAETIMINSRNLTRSLAAGLKEGGIAGRMVSNTLGLEEVGAAFDKYKEGVMQTVYALSGKQVTQGEMKSFLDLYMPQAGESTWLIKDKTKRLKTILSTLRSKVRTGMLFNDAMTDAIASAGAPGSGQGGGGQKPDLSKVSTEELLRSLNAP